MGLTMKKWIPGLIMLAVAACACSPAKDTPAAPDAQSAPPAVTDKQDADAPQAADSKAGEVDEFLQKAVANLRTFSKAIDGMAALPGVPADKMKEAASQMSQAADKLESEAVKAPEKVKAIEDAMKSMEEITKGLDTNNEIQKKIAPTLNEFKDSLVSIAGKLQPEPQEAEQAQPEVQEAPAGDKLPEAMPAPSGSPVVSDTGLKYTILVEGNGDEAKDGNVVSVHYTGTLTNGSKFDSSLDRGVPFEFKLGEGQVIKGWDEGVKGMKIGEKRRLEIPPELGYGEHGAGGVIPPNATLLFDVELLEVK